MIDQNLIEKNKKNLASSVSARTTTPISSLYRIQDVLDPLILDKLDVYLRSVPADRWQTVEGQENTPRQKISWDGDTVIEELHEIFQSLTEEINLLFPDNRKNFWGISIWKDSPGYKINWHTDNPDIDAAMQVYLYTNPGSGTVFGSENDPVLMPSEHNSGYLIKQDSIDKVPHRSENLVPERTTRYSLYAVWSRIAKKDANS
jgi:hypothetical protein